MLDGVPVADLSTAGLLGLAILLLLLGRIVPRSTLQDKIEECDRWREAYEKERDARALSDAQTAELLEMAKTTNSVIMSIFAVLKEREFKTKPAGDDLDATKTP